MFRAMKSPILKIATGLAALLFSQAVWPWGMSTDLNEEWSKSQLVFTVLQKKQIKYCVDIQSSRFDEASIKMQIESALKLWLDAIQPLKIGAVTVTEVECTDSAFNLKVQVGEEKAYPTLGSYQIPEWQGDHYYSLVKIDSDYSHVVDGKSYRNEDFLKFAGGKLRSQSSLIQGISFKKKKTLQDFCSQEGLDCQAAFLSTYITLIHEIGHSFGLCDTGGDHADCDSKFMTVAKEHPASVMKLDTFFYLTKDDVDGIRALFTRYKK
jgi:hypothetical protein